MYWGQDPGLLPQQLFGRIGTAESGVLKALVEQASVAMEGDALVPLRPALQPPGALILTLESHRHTVRGALLVPDGQRALAWSNEDNMPNGAASTLTRFQGLSGGLNPL